MAVGPFMAWGTMWQLLGFAESSLWPSMALRSTHLSLGARLELSLQTLLGRPR